MVLALGEQKLPPQSASVRQLPLAQLLPAKPSIMEPLTPVALPFITPGGGGMMLAQAF